MRASFLLALLGAPLLLSACTVGPDYRVPTAPSAPQWSTASVGAAGARADLATWWHGFHDATLDSLVDRAIAGNLDLQLAQARIREARASRVETSADLWPSLTGTASRTRCHNSACPQGGRVTENLFQTGLDASWELDIFGGTRRGIESADANLAATIEDERATLVSLLGEVTTDYVDLRDAQTRLKIAGDALTSEEDTLGLTQAKFQAGLGSALDVAQAQAVVATTRATIPGFETAARAAIHQLSVLTGAPPETLRSELAPSAPVPAMTTGVTLGLPAELLRQRPDVRAAERRVAKANANIGVAVASEYPSFALVGSIGSNALRLSQLGSAAASAWSFGPSVTVPIFNAGKLAAQVDVNRALWDQAVITYRTTVLAAAQQVEDAIATYNNERDHQATLARSVAAYSDALSLSRDLYSRGLTSFLNVLDAERSLYTTQDQLSQSEAALSTDMIALFKALGGGWTDDEASADARAS